MMLRFKSGKAEQVFYAKKNAEQADKPKRILVEQGCRDESAFYGDSIPGVKVNDQ